MEDRRKTPAQRAKTKDWTPTILAMVVLAIFASANYYVFTHELPQGNETLVARVLGTIDMATSLVLSYYFVSSASSESKTETIATMATTAGKQQVATDKAVDKAVDKLIVPEKIAVDVNMKEVPDAGAADRPAG